MKAPAQPSDRFVADRLPPPDQCLRRVYALPGMQIADNANLVAALFDRALDMGHAERPFLHSDTVTLTYREAQHWVR